ncbi:MAG: hypothetical protein L3J32_02035 [Rhizobiaceae bacterium]|nr:hypothetical protein [Rhizobiaceae bacterium]
MIEILKIIHLLALMFGAAASFGNLYMLMAKGPADLPSPGFTGQLRFMFRLSALVAILTIWASGVLLLFIKYGWWINSFSFDAKIVFATIVLLIVLFLNLLAMRTPKGPGAPPSYVPVLHIIGAGSLVLAMAFAVVAFV